MSVTSFTLHLCATNMKLHWQELMKIRLYKALIIEVFPKFLQALVLVDVRKEFLELLGHVF